MREKLEAMKDVRIAEPVVTIRSAMNADTEAKFAELADALVG